MIQNVTWSEYFAPVNRAQWLFQNSSYEPVRLKLIYGGVKDVNQSEKPTKKTRIFVTQC